MFDVVAPAGTGERDARAPDGDGRRDGRGDAPGPGRPRRRSTSPSTPGPLPRPRRRPHERRCAWPSPRASRRRRSAAARHVDRPCRRSARRCPGARVELQRYVRERFDYLPLLRPALGRRRASDLPLLGARHACGAARGGRQGARRVVARAQPARRRARPTGPLNRPRRRRPAAVWCYSARTLFDGPGRVWKAGSSPLFVCLRGRRSP